MMYFPELQKSCCLLDVNLTLSKQLWPNECLTNKFFFYIYSSLTCTKSTNIVLSSIVCPLPFLAILLKFHFAALVHIIVFFSMHGHPLVGRVCSFILQVIQAVMCSGCFSGIASLSICCQAIETVMCCSGCFSGIASLPIYCHRWQCFRQGCLLLKQTKHVVLQICMQNLHNKTKQLFALNMPIKCY